MITKNSEGDRTDPCFTPRLLENGADRLLLSFTQLIGDWYQALMRRHDLPLMPIENRWCNRIGSSTESKTFSIS